VAARRSRRLTRRERAQVVLLGVREVPRRFVAPPLADELLGLHRLDLGDPRGGRRARAWAGAFLRPLGVGQREIGLTGVAVPFGQLQPLVVEPHVAAEADGGEAVDARLAALVV